MTYFGTGIAPLFPKAHPYDDEGKQYLDFESGIWSTVLGHSHPRINRTMKTQIGKVVHLGTRYPSFLAQDAAIAILDIVGINNGKCVFLSSGSEAVELGVQTARRCTEKPLLLTFSNSYLAAYGSAGKKSTAEWQLLALEFHPHENISATWLYHALLDKGFLVGYYHAGNILRFDPALTVDEKDISHLVECIDSILDMEG